MPIEDVQYLLSNSVKETVQVFVDSATRKKEFFPHPSHYTVKFTDPIRNVYGVEVLDASIPSASYSVDDHTNKLKIIFLREPQDNGGGDTEVPSSAVVLTELGSNTVLRRWIDEVCPRKVLVLSFEQYNHAIEQGFEVTPYDASHKMGLTSEYGFLVRHPRVELALYRDYKAYDGNPFYEIVHYDGVFFAVKTEDNEDVIAMFRDPEAMLSVVSRTRNAAFNDTVWMVYVTWISVVESHEPSIITFLDASFPHQKQVTTEMLVIDSGDYDITALLEALSQRMVELGDMTVQGVGDIEISRTLRYSFRNPQMAFAFDMEKSTLRRGLGFDEIMDRRERQMYFPVVYGNNRSMFFSIYDEQRQAWKLDAPGMVDMSGDRYVRLRCPQIEDFTRKPVGVDSDSGLAVFKLLGGNQQTHLRLDFVNIVRKPIHPISKLDRLTFSFVRPDGELYNFRGLNHTMLIGVQTYAPDQKMEYKGSVLNPEYKPDILAYQMDKYVAHSDSDAELSAYGGGDSVNDHDDDRDYDYTTDGSYTTDQNDDDDDVSSSYSST